MPDKSDSHVRPYDDACFKQMINIANSHYSMILELQKHLINIQQEAKSYGHYGYEKLATDALAVIEKLEEN